MEVKLINSTPNMLKMIYAQTRGTTTSGSFADIFENDASVERQLALVTDALESTHWSVSRGASFTFSIEGISRACSAQLLRSSVGVAAEERSLRYCKINRSDGPWFVSPKFKTQDQQALFDETMTTLETVYDAMLAMGVAPEDARSILPLATKTNVMITFSFEALHTFLGSRICTRAQDEIRTLAIKMRKEALKVEPWAAPFFTIKCKTLGFCPEARPEGCALLVENGGNIPRKSGHTK